MARLFIAEKPSLAKAIYTELGVLKREDGFVRCKEGSLVTWCFGHLLEQASPATYLPEEGKKFWRKEDLPIFPPQWQMHCKFKPKTDKPDPAVKKQLNLIKKLVTDKQVDTIVNAGDPDREGQLLVDEVLEFFGNKKPVLRFWSSAIDPASIRKALKSLKPNNHFVGMKNSALARSRADWLLGMNLSRAYTLSLPKDAGQKSQLIAVGRVQTPTLMLVAIRDEAIRSFVPVPYLNIYATCEFNNQTFTAKWQPKENQDGLNADKTLLVNLSIGKRLAEKLQQTKTASVLNVETKAVSKAAPLPFSLSAIQTKASALFGFSAEQTLKICQSLYEEHKVASYPRTDCGYLPESQLHEVDSVLQAIAKTCPPLKSLITKANPKLRSKAWNDSKVTAHHGIIPTTFAGDWSKFTSEQKSIYLLIAQYYLVQFFPAYEYDSTKAILALSNETFVAEGKIVTQQGWKEVLSTDKDEDTEAVATLPAIRSGSQVTVCGINTKEDKTKPPSPYTEGKLIEDMERIHKAFADYPNIKAKLKETNGIGTPATRAAVISELKRKAYLVESGKGKTKTLHVSADGMKVLKTVSRKVSSAILTAQWEEKLDLIENNTMTVDEFINELKTFILNILKELGFTFPEHPRAGVQ